MARLGAHPGKQPGQPLSVSGPERPDPELAAVGQRLRVTHRDQRRPAALPRTDTRLGPAALRWADTRLGPAALRWADTRLGPAALRWADTRLGPAALLRADTRLGLDVLLLPGTLRPGWPPGRIARRGGPGWPPGRIARRFNRAEVAAPPPNVRRLITSMHTS